MKSPTDPKSFILNEKLNEVKNWNETKSIVNIIIESHNLMRNNFPFSKGGPTQSQSYGQGNSVSSFDNYRDGKIVRGKTNSPIITIQIIKIIKIIKEMRLII